MGSSPVRLWSLGKGIPPHIASVLHQKVKKYTYTPWYVSINQVYNFVLFSPTGIGADNIGYIYADPKLVRNSTSTGGLLCI